MNRDELRKAVLEELSDVAPDIDMATFDDRASLQDEYDLDSMDLLNLAAAVHKRLGVNIPDQDYARMRCVADLLDYLQERV
ncbi:MULTISPECIES: acyl carrier protein [Marinobacter]|uniref:Acyl carrier protein n=1 Tax=Marinobacter segnicrescens TaxID=430453 RepID=A0A1H9ZBU9_9GAMM|nr:MULTISPECIES: phosphopantetheine-binding protein [Marinobacter]UZD64605.1 phosphopantetheine-binding protein [Marinobacter sp. AN1]SES78531.1 Acyl carrier protein [Marinobacter segnicrescens]